jgi:hypothetical protein
MNKSKPSLALLPKAVAMEGGSKNDSDSIGEHLLVASYLKRGKWKKTLYTNVYDN